MPVSTPRREYSEAIHRWQRARDCFEGSDAVKAQGTKYLPKLDSHKQGAMTDLNMSKYDEYKMRALFYNATGRTVEGLAGALFQTNPAIELPEQVRPDMEDVTLDGKDAAGFGLQTTREVLLTGRYGILVEMPAEESALYSEVRRPYWCGYRAEDIISWRTERHEGREILTRVVVLEKVEEPDLRDPFAMVDFDQYRVLDLVEGVYTQTLWRRRPNSDTWVQFGPEITPTRRGEPLSFIPFTFVGPSSVSSSVVKPPLDDLVIVNLSHYRTMADLEHGRHFTALPTPWVAGARARKGDEPLAIGSGVAWSLEKEGRAGMLEFSGAGLGALVTAEGDKRKMMATLGARLLEDQPTVTETALAVNMRHGGESATLRTVAQSVEHALTIVLRTHVWWLGTEVRPSDLKEVMYEVNKDFFTSRMTPDELRALLGALQAEAISYSTFYAQLQRGEVARPGVTAEEEQAEILAASAAFQQDLSGMPGDFGGNGLPPGSPAPQGEVLDVSNPYHIEKRGGRFCVVKTSTGTAIPGGCHPTHEEALKHLQAVEINVHDARN
jgi:hypothetical protein